MPKSVKIVIDNAGGARHLLDETPEMAPVYEALGKVDETWRNSHVETWSSLSVAAREYVLAVLRLPQPGPAAWWADMLPVNGPVLGPFDKHSEALAAEVEWLREHGLPVPVPDLPCEVPPSQE